MMDKKPYAYVWGNSSIDFRPSGEPDDTPLYLNTPWIGLTDADRQAAFESLPDMFEGFLHKWGWLHFSKAIEAKLKEKNT